MKNIVIIFKRTLLLSISITSLLFGQKEFGKITLPLGWVQVQKNGAGAFKKAMPRMPVHENDIIKTLAKSRCEIKDLSPASSRFGISQELFQYDRFRHQGNSSSTKQTPRFPK